MSIWTRISDALSALAKGESLSAIFDLLRAPPERTVAFTIAVISLGAKMAKADGLVTRDEVMAFREVFQVAEEDTAQAARVFDLARKDVAGFELYARRIAAMFEHDREVLENLMEGLFHISMADGEYHCLEEDFLRVVADEFELPELVFRSLQARYVPGAVADPYTVLGLNPGTPFQQVRDHYRKLVRDTHPDRMMANGVPEEGIKLATKRMTLINAAWDEIRRAEKALV